MTIAERLNQRSGELDNDSALLAEARDTITKLKQHLRAALNELGTCDGACRATAPCCAMRYLESLEAK